MTAPYYFSTMLLVLNLTLSHSYAPQRARQHLFANNNLKSTPLTTAFLSTPSDGVTIENKNNNNNDNSADEIAKQLRERAYNLRREAKSAEQSLRSAMERKKEVENIATDEWIDSLLGLTSSVITTPDEDPVNNKAQDVKNNNIPAASTLALRIRANNLLSPSKLMRICERLHDRETAMMIGPEGFLSKDNDVVGGGFVLGDYANNSLERKKEESEKITGLLDRILQAVQIIDEERGQPMNEIGSKLRVRITDLRQSRDALIRRKIDNLVNNSSAIIDKKGMELENLVRSSIDGPIIDNDNDKSEERKRQAKIMKRLIETPTWLPPSIAPFAATSPVEVSVAHWKMIKSDVLADSKFICTSWDATEVAAIYRGRMMSTRAIANGEENREDNLSVEDIFDDLLNRVKNHPDLSKKIQLFIVGDFEWRPPMGSRNDEPPPVIIALAKEVVPEQESERSLSTKSLATFSTLATLFTTLAYAVSSFALNPSFFNAIVKENDATSFPMCLPVFWGVLAISALHEVGHIVAAKKYGVKLGTPVPLPSLQVGSFGNITPLRSFPSSRSALFDIAISGPCVAMISSLTMIVVGLRLTMTAQSFTSFPVVPAALMKSSFLVGSIASIVFPKVMLIPLSQPIPIHGVFLVGLAGLFISSVNLLPIGRLDGGRASMAAYGRRSASLISLLSLIVLAFYSFNGLSGIIIFWGALVVLTQQRLADIPVRNEVTEISGLRVTIYNTLLVLSLLTIAPFPGGVSSI
jgi:Zn-dependent protease